ncbi:MAG: HDIG domain-containing protein [Eubacteriaceae bacterium]|nr:HDIG domain-containing protein [Eubacteriaceae bacterium]
MKKSNKWLTIFAGAMLFVIAFWLVYVAVAPKRYELAVDQPAGTHVIAQRTIVDAQETERLRKQAEDKVGTVYDPIPGIGVRVPETVGVIMDILNGASETDTVSILQKKIMDNTQIQLELYSIERILAMSQIERNDMSKHMQVILTEIYKEEISLENLEDRKNYVFRYIDNTVRSQTGKMEARNILGKVIVPNVEENPVKTAEAKTRAREDVQPVIYAEGTKIVSQGEIITEQKYQFLSENGLLKGNKKQEAVLYVGIFAFLVMLGGVLLLYLYQFEKSVLFDIKKMIIVISQIILYLAFAVLLSAISIYLIPLTMLVITLSLILKPKKAMIINLFAIILTAFAIKADASFVVIMLSSAILAAVCMRRVVTQSAVYRYSVAIGFINALIVVLTDIILFQLSVATAIHAGYVILATTISGFLSVRIVYIWEWLFNVPTSVRMQEITSLNHPLVKRLMQEAPGTYQHSVNVSSLAEAAAEEIDGDILLAKAGGLFHDIGKLENPIYFSENQEPKNNPHDRLETLQSVEVLRKHVADGIALSKKYKLPKHVQDVIASHHGTSVMEYFYCKEKNESGEADCEQYRYNGPKPVLKEATIVMLADGSEAAVKSLTKPNETQINEMVQKIFKSKENDLQLSECELTFAELNKIKKVFIRNLNAMYHERIQYPHQENEEIEKLTEVIQKENEEKYLLHADAIDEQLRDENNVNTDDEDTN